MSNFSEFFVSRGGINMIEMKKTFTEYKIEKKRKWYTFKSVFVLSVATICNEKKGEKSKEPMGTNTQEGPTVQESADDWVWIAVLHQLADSTDIRKTLISVYFHFPCRRINCLNFSPEKYLFA